MRILGIFIAALVGILYAKSTEKKQFTVDQSGDVSEPTTESFSSAVNQALEITVNTVNDTVQNVTSGVSAMIFGTKYDSLITSSALQYGIDPNLLYKLLYAESHFRDDIITGKVRSSTGALGIAQFMPATAVEELGSESAALDPNKAIPGAARYLAKLIKSTGSIDGGVAAYNWGVGNVKKKGLANAPKETVNYVASITGTNLKG